LGFSRYFVAACFTIASLNAFVIIGGSINYNQNGFDGFSLNLSDGFSFSGGSGDPYNPHGSNCFSQYPFCSLLSWASAPFNVVGEGVNNNFLTSGYVEFAPLLVVTPAINIIEDQIFELPFTAEGFVYGPYNPRPIQPCILPSNPGPSTCYEPVTGSGTVEITVGYEPLYSKFAPYPYFIRSAIYTFSAASEAPEPSTVAFCTIAGIVAVCRRRRRT
jgi:hypothetical protein